ncbi:hypothetical protein ACSBR1_040508 [Camellia fascicularis]
MYEEAFEFLFDLKKLSSTDDECLNTFCANLEDFLKHGKILLTIPVTVASRKKKLFEVEVN